MRTRFGSSAAFGTHLRPYAMDMDGNVTDITPVASRTASQSLTLTVTSGSATVTAAWTGHGLVVDQKFMLESAPEATQRSVALFLADLNEALTICRLNMDGVRKILERYREMTGEKDEAPLPDGRGA